MLDAVPVACSWSFLACLGGDGRQGAALQLALLGPGAAGLVLVFAYALTDALDDVSAPLRTPIAP